MLWAVRYDRRIIKRPIHEEHNDCNSRDNGSWFIIFIQSDVSSLVFSECSSSSRVRGLNLSPSDYFKHPLRRKRLRPVFLSHVHNRWFRNCILPPCAIYLTRWVMAPFSPPTPKKASMVRQPESFSNWVHGWTVFKDSVTPGRSCGIAFAFHSVLLDLSKSFCLLLQYKDFFLGVLRPLVLLCALLGLLKRIQGFLLPVPFLWSPPLSHAALCKAK